MVPSASRSAPQSHEAARAAVAALDLVGLPAAVLSMTQRLVAFNSSFERLMPDVIRQSHNQVLLADYAAQQLLGNALARLGCGGDAGTPQSIPIAPGRSQAPTVLHFLPIPAEARAALPGVLVLLVVTTFMRRGAPSVDAIQRLFAMTPAEARVARCLTDGGTIRGIAHRLGLSPETVRSQLKAALAKAGCARNIDLAVLLASAWPSIAPVPE